MDLGIKNRTALVCAASRGIGQAIAQSLVCEGVRVAICARNEENLSQARDTLQASSEAEVLSVVADLSVSSEITRLIQTVQTQLGSIDILINNVGGPAPGTLMELTDDQWHDGFQRSFMSIVRLTKAVLPGMVERKWGRIIAIASNTAKEPRESILLSSTIRASIAAFNKAISTNLAPQNVLIHTVCPGPIGTERVLNLAQEIANDKNISFEQAQESLTDQIPIGRMGKPEEIASLVAYLVSQQSTFMTGSTIAIDGGQLRSW